MDNKGKGIIAYIFGWLGGLIVLLAFKKDNDKKITIHACQSITVSVGVMVLSFAGEFVQGLTGFRIPFFSTVLYALEVLCVVFGIIKVVKDEDPELPVVGGIAKSIFSKAIDAAPETVQNEAPKTEDDNKTE